MVSSILFVGTIILMDILLKRIIVINYILCIISLYLIGIFMSIALLLKFFAFMKETIIAILISALWGIAHYVHDISRKWSVEKFSYGRFFTHIFLSWFVGYIVYSLMPHDSTIVWPVVGISWFSTTKILPLIERVGVAFVEKYLNKFL